MMAGLGPQGQMGQMGQQMMPSPVQYMSMDGSAAGKKNKKTLDHVFVII